MNTFDLLIIFKDGSKKIISGVSSYQLELGSKRSTFMINKDNNWSYIPHKQVKFFGRKAHWDDSVNSLQKFFDHIGTLPTCNDCKREKCVWTPSLGETVRYNCPLYLETADNEIEFENNQNMDKQQFVERCGELLSIAKPHLISAEYRKGEDMPDNKIEKYVSDGEYVIVTCENGYIYVIDISANSLNAIAEAIFHAMAFK